MPDAKAAEPDATCVRLLREAGAIIVGKTNCPEFLMNYETDNRIIGRTNNPWNLERTAGGSSGGESARNLLVLFGWRYRERWRRLRTIPGALLRNRGTEAYVRAVIWAAGHVPAIEHPGGSAWCGWANGSHRWKMYGSCLEVVLSTTSQTVLDAMSLCTPHLNPLRSETA